MSDDVIHNTAPQPKILFVDDEPRILKSLTRFGRSKKWDVVTATSGEEAISIAQDTDFHAIISDMRMPEMSGAELLKIFEKKFPSTIRILLTGYSDIEALGSAINDGHISNYLTKPWDESLLYKVISEAIILRESEKEKEIIENQKKSQNIKLSKLAILLDKRVKERTMEVDQALHLLQNSHEQSKNVLLNSVAVINRIFEWKESRSHGQSEFVTRYAVNVSKKLQLSDTDTESVRLAALMYRVGMLALPDDIRKKPLYSLTKEEFEIYKQYPLWGEQSIKHAPELNGIAKIVRHHREYINGNGYPDGLTGKEIPIAAQIIGLVSDFYDAYSGQAGKNIQGASKATDYIKQWTGKRHDSNLVSVFLDQLEGLVEDPIQTCLLSTTDLEINMVLNQDIISRSGTLLLAKNTILSAPHIAKLIEYEKSYREVFEISILISLPTDTEKKT